MNENPIVTWLSGIAAGGLALYAAFRTFKIDRRKDNQAELTDAAISQVIQTLREEVSRLSERLAAVEEQNRRCEERNDQLHAELMELKVKLHVT